jgi:hypothetical protein
MTFACSIAAILLLAFTCMIGLAWTVTCYYYWRAEEED